MKCRVWKSGLPGQWLAATPEGTWQCHTWAEAMRMVERFLTLHPHAYNPPVMTPADRVDYSLTLWRKGLVKL